MLARKSRRRRDFRDKKRTANAKRKRSLDQAQAQRLKIQRQPL